MHQSGMTKAQEHTDNVKIKSFIFYPFILQISTATMQRMNPIVAMPNSLYDFVVVIVLFRKFDS